MAQAPPQLFEKELWDNLEAALARVGDGIKSAQELTRIFRKRMSAEEEMAQTMLRMCMKKKDLPTSGLVSYGRGNREDLIDATKESGTVKAALAILLEETKKTSAAHVDIGNQILQQCVEPFEEFAAVAATSHKQLTVEGRGMEKEIEEANESMAKSQLAYYRACKDHSDAFNSASPETSTLEQAKLSLDGEYKMQVQLANQTQLRVYNKGLRALLSQLEQLEVQRIGLTKKKMQIFITLTTTTLAELIGTPVKESVSPSIASIDATKDIKVYCEKNKHAEDSRGGEPWHPPGSIAYREYDCVRDVPAELKSVSQLHESGGGPVHCGWLSKEGHMVRSWKKRWCVIWPRNFDKMGMDGPSIFYYEDAESTSPKGVVELRGLQVGVPKKARKGKEFLLSIVTPETSKAEKGKEKHKIVVECVSKEDMEEWRSVFDAATQGRGDWKPKLDLFGAKLEDIIAAQSKDHEDKGLDCQVPLCLLAMFDRLESFGCTTTEGIFRIPGDSDYMKQLRNRFEEHELTIADPRFDVHVWASTLKLFFRELKEPVFSDLVYNDCILLADEHRAGVPIEPARVLAIVQRLSKSRQAVIEHLCHFLGRIDAEASKMSVANLAIVFSPCLLRCEDLQMALKNTSKETAFTALLIEAAGAQAPSATYTRDIESYKTFCPEPPMLDVDLRLSAPNLIDCGPPPTLPSSPAPLLPSSSAPKLPASSVPTAMKMDAAAGAGPEPEAKEPDALTAKLLETEAKENSPLGRAMAAAEARQRQESSVGFMVDDSPRAAGGELDDLISMS